MNSLDPVREIATSHSASGSLRIAKTLWNIPLMCDSVFTSVFFHETTRFCVITFSGQKSPTLIEYLRNSILCTNNIRFSLGGTSSNRIDGVAINSPLDPALTSVFLSTLEKENHDNISLPIIFKCCRNDFLLPTDSGHLPLFFQCFRPTCLHLSISFKE